jgi:hypothetical protein
MQREAGTQDIQSLTIQSLHSKTARPCVQRSGSQGRSAHSSGGPLAHLHLQPRVPPFLPAHRLQNGMDNMSLKVLFCWNTKDVDSV